LLLSGLLDEPGSDAGGGAGSPASGLGEALFAFAILTPLLFVVQLGSLAPALSFAFTLLYGWARRGEAAAALARRWPLLLIPAYALLSILWSDYPAVTAKHAGELCLTVMGGLLLSASRSPAGVLSGAWAAFGLFMTVSFALGGTIHMGSMVSAEAAGTAFAGLNGVKNLFGMTAALAVLTSIFMLTRSAVRGAWAVFLAAAALIVVELYLVYVARSAGALIGLVLAVCAFTVMGAMTPLSRAGRIVAASLMTVVLTGAAVLGYAFANTLTQTALDIFHKDPTLTGRSYLWYRAGDFIAERPLLGRGFEAFWVHGNIDAEGMWQYGQMTARSGFNFHNTLIELLIHFGWIGAALTVAVFLAAFVGLIRRCVLQPGAVSAFYVGFVVFQLVRMPFESLMPSSVDFATVLMFAALGYGFHRLAQPVTIVRVETLPAAPVRAAPRRARPGWAAGRPSSIT